MYHSSDSSSVFMTNKTHCAMFFFLSQGVVKYTMPVEVFVTGIKTKSKRSTFILVHVADQGLKMNSEQLISTNQHSRRP